MIKLNRPEVVEKFTVERQTGQVKSIESDLTFLKSSEEINEHKKTLVGDSQFYFRDISLKVRIVKTDQAKSSKSILRK